MQKRMKSMENVIKNISSNVDSTFSENITASLQNNQDYSLNNKTQNERNDSNSTSFNNLYEWKVSSLKSSTRLEPVKIQCETGAILKEALCSKFMNM